MNIFEARKNNAFRIGRHIKQLLDTGHLVFDEYNCQIIGVEFKGFSDAENSGLSFRYRDGNGKTVYYDTDRNLDNGAQTKIEAFNDTFKEWHAVHPSNVKSIFPHQH